MKKLDYSGMRKMADLIIGMIVLVVLIIASIVGGTGVIVGFLLFPLVVLTRKVVMFVLDNLEDDNIQRREAK